MKVDWEIEMARIESEREVKELSEAHLEKIRYGFETKHQELRNQLKLQRAKLELEF